MQTAIYPGSFDPVTLGHVDIINRAAKLFDRVVVCVVENANKNTLLSLEERCGHVENPVVVRGLRALTDFEYEFMMALTNKKLDPRVETIFLASDERYTYLSSSGVKEIAWFNGAFSQFVPEEIAEDLRGKFNGRNK